MAKAIEPHQIRKIQTAKSVLRMDDDTYRDMLQHRYNVDSCKKLSYLEAIDLINYLRDKGFKPKRKRATIKRGEKEIKLASVYQLQLIDVLQANIVWEHSFLAWLNKRMNIIKVVTADEAYKVIEGLKGMLGIKTKDIERCTLPFPDSYELTGIAEKWYYDTTNNKLHHVVNGEVVSEVINE